MITYHTHMKIIHNLKIVVFEFFEFQNIISKCSKFQKSFVKCKCVVMCMTYKQSCVL